MNLHELRALQGVHDYPCVTITLPTHRTFPDNKQDPIRVKNLVTEATNRLLGEFPKREVAPLLDRLEGLVADIDYQHTLDGLVLTVNRNMAHEYVLPFGLEERVVIDETFFTRDLVRALNRTYRYWVLALSEQPTRLYLATRENLEEIQHGGFPMQHLGPGGDAPLPDGLGVNPSKHRDERHRQFFSSVDRAFDPLFAQEPLPIALVGVDRYQAFFREVSPRSGDVIATLHGSYDSMTPHDLGRLIWPVANDGFAARRRRVLERLGDAVGQHRVASTLDEVWYQARLGRGDTMIVEQGYHQPARVRDTGHLDQEVTDPTAPDVLDDAVDDTIMTVLAKGGRVVFVDDGQLAEHGRIALILRY